MKKKNIVVICIIVLLIVAVVLLAVLNRPETPLVSGQIEILANGNSLVVYTAEDILAMPSTEFEKSVESSSFADQSGVWTGVALADLLNKAAPNWQDSYSMVAARAEDGYVTAFDADEAAEAENIYICYYFNGETLGTMDENGEGPFRIIVRNDEFGTRCTRWICQLELQ